MPNIYMCEEHSVYMKIIFRVSLNLLVLPILSDVYAYRALIGEKRAKISEWISKIDYYSHHREMKARVLSETGQWFLARREFKDWIGSDQSSLLWLRGNGMPLHAR